MNSHRYYRDKLANWMLTNGFATGHGDTFDDLLAELDKQVEELRTDAIRYRQTKREPIQ